ncbi:hypothetical protein HanRHA438_Chr12g0575191 [Helianthus annuus]|nr:hypothetical protein HanRHA438_Chr12g0575191 [Helianthus annuus]
MHTRKFREDFIVGIRTGDRESSPKKLSQPVGSNTCFRPTHYPFTIYTIR